MPKQFLGDIGNTEATSQALVDLDPPITPDPLDPPCDPTSNECPPGDGTGLVISRFALSDNHFAFTVGGIRTTAAGSPLIAKIPSQSTSFTALVT